MANINHQKQLSPQVTLSPADFSTQTHKETFWEVIQEASACRALCIGGSSSASPMRQKVPTLLLRHCGGTSKGIYGSEPSELPTSVFLPLLPISYSNCFGRRRIRFLWNASTWLGTSDMIRYIIAFIHLNTGSGPGTQFVATDLLSNHKISCGTQVEHKPKDLPLNPLKDQVSYLVSSVAM